MTPIETEATEYIVWLQVHNYAETTVAAGSVTWLLHSLLRSTGVDDAGRHLELLQAYQQELYEHRKRYGQPLAVATQAQRLVPVTHFFTWLRRSGRLATQPGERPADAQARPPAPRGDPEQHRDERCCSPRLTSRGHSVSATGPYSRSSTPARFAEPN